MASLNFSSLYDDLSYSSTQYSNLRSMFSGYEYYTDCEFVAFRSGQYDYYLVAGELEWSNDILTGSPLDGQDSMFVAHYYTRNFDDRTQYEFIDDITSFRLSDIDYMTVSNISDLGFYDSSSESYQRSVFGMELSIACTVFLLDDTYTFPSFVLKNGKKMVI